MNQEFYLDRTTLIIRLPAELDHHVADRLRVKADKFIEQQNIKTIVFDFAETSFMDSSGIGMLMGRYKSLSFIGGRVAAVRVSERVGKIFTMSGLYKIIDIYDKIPAELQSSFIKGGSL